MTLRGPNQGGIIFCAFTPTAISLGLRWQRPPAKVMAPNRIASNRIGEIGIVGMNAAVANAVFNATN
jgi:hypothetical protein